MVMTMNMRMFSLSDCRPDSGRGWTLWRSQICVMQALPPWDGLVFVSARL